MYPSTRGLVSLSYGTTRKFSLCPLTGQSRTIEQNANYLLKLFYYYFLNTLTGEIMCGVHTICHFRDNSPCFGFQQKQKMPFPGVKTSLILCSKVVAEAAQAKAHCKGKVHGLHGFG